MKKFLTITAAFALVLGLSQCRKPNAPTINGIGETQHIIIKANNGNDGSKVNPTVSGAVLGLTWETEDEITVTGGATGTLTLTNGAGETAATFEGVITKVNDNDLIFTCGSVDYTNQEGTLAWVKSNICLKGNSAYSESGNYDVAMTLPYAVLKLDLSAFGTATPGTTVTISAGGSEVASVTGVTNAADNPYYVAMPAAASREYTFIGGGKTGKATWALAANTFYTKSVSSTGEAIVVMPTILYIPGDFTVNQSTGKKVNFAKGNLYWDGSSWKLEANQWDYRTWAGKNSCIGGAVTTNGTPSDNCGLFKFGTETEAIDGSDDIPSGDFFAASGFTVEGETWRTLSEDEWRNLLGIYGASSARDNASSLHGWRTVAGVNGFVILPDGSTTPLNSISSAEQLANAGAVFLPAAGSRQGTRVFDVGSRCGYWSSTASGDCADYLTCMSDYWDVKNNEDRDSICSVRLVR